MKPKVFLEFVEIQSMVASILPFIIGLLYVWYNARAFHLGVSLLLFVVIELMHMAVNANDNIQDFIYAKDEQTFKKITNVVGHYQISVRLAVEIILGLSSIAAILGLVVTKLTWGATSGWFLTLGIIGYVVGYFYAGGPLPISHTPFGEVFSGVTMGYLIMLATVYVNLAPQHALTWTMAGHVFLASGLAVFAISNIMLANNLCDVEEDRLNGRKTIVVLLGQRFMLLIWWLSYGLGYLMLVASVVVGLLPKLTLLALLSFPLVWRNNLRFSAVMIKSKSFVYAIKNSVILTVSFALAMGIGILFNV
ncbi:UbiA family prenyltransferase [Furfurilactobacillus curtus]|uniref:1,4-dihydroxy-2-naphthoate octaprenyltransferase n=1 Tax=Furfurilactobacillus curtus TaxID=1746200 RepID=A0ABQ5JSQ3_9LACO